MRLSATASMGTTGIKGRLILYVSHAGDPLTFHILLEAESLIPSQTHTRG